MTKTLSLLWSPVGFWLTLALLGLGQAQPGRGQSAPEHPNSVPGLSARYVQAGEALERKGTLSALSEAIISLQVAHQLDPKAYGPGLLLFNAYVKDANALRLADRFVEAAAQLRRADQFLDNDAGSRAVLADAHEQLAVSLDQANQPSVAIPELLTTIRLEQMNGEPAAERLYRHLGFDYDTLGEYKASVRAYRMAVRLAPQDPNTHQDFANVLDDWGHPQEAILQYEKALALDGSGQPVMAAYTYGNIGDVYDELWNYPQAIAAYSKALALLPGDSLDLYNLGLAYFHNKRYSQAETCDLQALGAVPSTPLPDAPISEYDSEFQLSALRASIHLALGIVEFRLGHFRDASDYYHQVLSDMGNLEWHTPDAWSRFGYMGSVAERMAQLREATREDHASAPSGPTHYRDLRHFTYAHGELATATKDYRLEIHAMPTFAPPYNDLGRMLYQSGDRQAGRQEWQHVLTMRDRAAARTARVLLREYPLSTATVSSH